MKIPKFFIQFSFRPANVFAIWITSKLSVNFLWQLSTVKLLNRCCFMFDLSHVFQIQCKKRGDYNFSIENTALKWSEKFLTAMAVHCPSNVILLAIEYFNDSKGERQNIKLLSTQNNYSPSFGLKKLTSFFISSDKTDKKLSRSWKYKTRCRTKRRGGQNMAFDQGQVGPRAQLPRKAQEPHKIPVV